MAKRNDEFSFWGKVEIKDGCWEWKSTKVHTGYGQLKEGQRYYLAHRYAYELWHGEIPEGKNVLHKCDNRSCVNPDHLFLGTQQDNVHDMVMKGRGNYSAVMKYTDEFREEVRSAYIPKMFGNRKVAQMFGIPYSVAHAMIHGRKSAVRANLSSRSAPALTGR
jgi:hypothetical protein